MCLRCPRWRRVLLVRAPLTNFGWPPRTKGNLRKFGRGSDSPHQNWEFGEGIPSPTKGAGIGNAQLISSATIMDTWWRTRLLYRAMAMQVVHATTNRHDTATVDSPLCTFPFGGVGIGRFRLRSRRSRIEDCELTFACLGFRHRDVLAFSLLLVTTPNGVQRIRTRIASFPIRWCQIAFFTPFQAGMSGMRPSFDGRQLFNIQETQ